MPVQRTVRNTPFTENLFNAFIIRKRVWLFPFYQYSQKMRINRNKTEKAR